MWVTRVAHTYRLPITAVYDWPHSDLVAAVASIVSDAERCPGCGLTDTDAWWVAADLVRCPTCEDRDRLLDSIRKEKSTHGIRATFTTLESEEESVMESAAARYTLAGAQARSRYRQGRSL